CDLALARDQRDRAGRTGPHAAVVAGADAPHAHFEPGLERDLAQIAEVTCDEVRKLTGGAGRGRAVARGELHGAGRAGPDPAAAASTPEPSRQTPIGPPFVNARKATWPESFSTGGSIAASQVAVVPTAGDPRRSTSASAPEPSDHIPRLLPASTAPPCASVAV